MSRCGCRSRRDDIRTEFLLWTEDGEKANEDSLKIETSGSFVGASRIGIGIVLSVRWRLTMVATCAGGETATGLATSGSRQDRTVSKHLSTAGSSLGQGLVPDVKRAGICGGGSQDAMTRVLKSLHLVRCRDHTKKCRGRLPEGLSLSPQRGKHKDKDRDKGGN